MGNKVGKFTVEIQLVVKPPVYQTARDYRWTEQARQLLKLELGDAAGTKVVNCVRGLARQIMYLPYDHSLRRLIRDNVNAALPERMPTAIYAKIVRELMAA